MASTACKINSIAMTFTLDLWAKRRPAADLAAERLLVRVWRIAASAAIMMLVFAIGLALAAAASLLRPAGPRRTASVPMASHSRPAPRSTRAAGVLLALVAFITT